MRFSLWLFTSSGWDFFQLTADRGRAIDWMFQNPTLHRFKQEA